jgi:hypothetical protein
VKIKNKLGVMIFGLVVLSFLLAVNCAEKGTEPDTNIPPDTFIDGFQIKLAPDSATCYNTTIFWRGSDPDGAIYWYYWQIISDTSDSLYLYEIERNEDGDSIGVDTTNISTWQATTDHFVTLRLDFPYFDKSYIFEVKAQDNGMGEDPTPAIDTVAISRVRELDFNYAPDTRIVTGPPNGAITGQGIHFVIQGEDIDGAVDSMEYKLDTDAEWTCVATDISTSSLTINVRNIPVGARTISFRAIDNFRKTDPSPVSVSVTVVNDIDPELSLSVRDGDKFVVPYTNPIMDELTISFSATVDFYYSYIDSFKVMTDTDTFTTTEAEVVYTDVEAGSYSINVTAYDIGGNWTNSGDIGYSVVELSAGDGVLCVNGIDWASYGEATGVWENGVAWGNRTHYKWWDLFIPPPSGGRPHSDSLLGVGSPPAWMFDTTFFDAVVWMGNNYSGDIDFWEDMESTLMAYLEMGGSILLPTRFGSDFFFDELTAYAHISSWDTGVNPTSLVAQHDSLTDISRTGSQSYTDIPTTDHSSTVTVLYEAENYPGEDAGFIVLPNGAGGGGAFCFIAGRNYRWDNTELKDNIDVILRYFMGITN